MTGVQTCALPISAVSGWPGGPHPVDSAEIKQEVLIPKFPLVFDDIPVCPNLFAAMFPFEVWFAENF